MRRVPHPCICPDVARTTLAHERGLARERSGHGTAPRGHAEGYEWDRQRAGRADLVPAQATETGRSADGGVRQHVAALIAFERAPRWSAQRAHDARAQGRPPGLEGSIARLCASEIARGGACAHAEIAGTDALLTGPTSSAGGIVAEVLVSTPAQSIAGGTHEIQRNIVRERVLDLPKEPQVDADVSFRDVRTNPDRRP